MLSSDIEGFLSWARYLYWSDILYQRWYTFGQNAEAEEPSLCKWQSFALCAQWFASVWVVIEGWRETSLSDPVVGKLLDTYPDYCELLRRFRNGIYHFQPDLFDPRLTTLPTSGEEPLMWVYALFYEFKRFFWEWAESNATTHEEKEALEELMYHAVGWKPTDILYARVEELKKLKHEAEHMISASDDRSSKEAKELLSAIAHMEDVIRSTEKSPILNVLPRLNPRH